MDRNRVQGSQGLLALVTSVTIQVVGFPAFKAFTMSAIHRPIAIALILAAVTGCQAPGFMGLSNSATSPDAATGSSRLMRARFRVLIPISLAQGISVAPPSATDAATSPNHFDDRAVVGAKVYLEGQSTAVDMTDDLGFASLALAQGRLTPVRAEFKTPDGNVTMSALVYIGKDTQSLPVFAINVASTLVTSKIAQKFQFSDLKYLDYSKLQGGVAAVEQAIRTPDGAYDPRVLPRLTRQWTVLDSAQALVRLDPILTQALAEVLDTPIPSADEAAASSSAPILASSSVTASASFSTSASRAASLSATMSFKANADATVSALAMLGDMSLFAADLNSRWIYDLYDPDGRPQGQLVRKVSKLSSKANGILVTGTETGTWGGHSRELRFLMKRSPSQVRVAAAYRPSVDYPLPLTDERSWQAAPGITAIAHAPSEESSGSWRIDFTQEKNQRNLAWSEWLAPGQGFTRMQWFDLHGHRWEARLQPMSDSDSNP